MGSGVSVVVMVEVQAVLMLGDGWILDVGQKDTNHQLLEMPLRRCSCNSDLTRWSSPDTLFVRVSFTLVHNRLLFINRDEVELIELLLLAYLAKQKKSHTSRG